MRVYAITPVHVDAEALSCRQARYDEISPPGVRVELHDVGAAAPRALETVADLRQSARLVAAALRAADDAGYDALLPDCVLDPGVDELAGELATPVHGLLRLTLDHIATQVAGAVTTTRAIADALTATHGLTTSVLTPDRAVLDADTRWLAGLGTAVNELAAAGAEVVINACAAGVLYNARSGRIPVVDPAAAALQRLVA
jgi:Asp/Glu/hydantoin racemase